MSRVLLLVPTTTYRASAFIDAVTRAGAEVVVGSERQQALAGPMAERFLLLPLDHPEQAADAIVEHAREHPLDAIVAIDDGGGLAAALASERLGLRHSPPAAVAATRDKAVTRELLALSGVSQPAFRIVGAGPGLAAEAAEELGYPVVVKPRTLAGSRGVIRADGPETVEAVATRVRAICAEAGGDLPESILVERYVGEEEVAVEGVLRAGRLDVLAVFDKPDPLTGPYFEETIYVTPSRHPHGIVVAVGALTAAATSALGLTEGPVHAEVRFGGGGGGVYVIEVAARTIGGRCSRAVGFEGGRSLEDAVIGHALGRDDDRPGSWRAVGARGVMMIPIPASGILEAVEGVDRAEAVDGIDGVEITIPRGRPVRAIPEGDRYLGFVFASGDEPGVVEEALRRAFARLEIRVSPAAV